MESILNENEILTGEKLYEQALSLVLGKAQREILIFDQNLSTGGYASLERFNLVRDFLANERMNKLTMVLQDAAFFNQKCPRLCDLIEIYGHALTVYEAGSEARSIKENFIIVDRKIYLKRFHIDQARFKFSQDDQLTVNLLIKRFEEIILTSPNQVTRSRLGL